MSIQAGGLLLDEGDISDLSGNAVLADHDGLEADPRHRVDGAGPVLLEEEAELDGDRLTLPFAERLDMDSTPEIGSFRVTVGGQSREVSEVVVEGDEVRLTLGSPAEEGQVVAVSYEVEAEQPGKDIRDEAGIVMAPFAPGAVAVTMDLADVFTDPDTDSSGGANDGDTYWNDGDGWEPTGDDPFQYKVEDDVEDDNGVSIEANKLTLNGVTIKDRAGNSAVLTHTAVTTQSGHQVDGVRPELVSTDGAVVDGATLTLTYDEPLDGSTTPPASAFTVTGGSSSRTVSNAVLSGSAVLLALDPAVEHGETGTRLSYRIPTGSGASPLRDLVGNAAARLSNQPVTNETPDATPPKVSKLEITSTGPFEVEENTTAVGQLEGVDWDEEDEVTGYGIAGGADGGLFTVDQSTGDLSFRQAPDYENPGDVESEDPASAAGDNEYILVVEVTSGEGERERTSEQAIRVRVRDVEMEETGEGETGEDPSDFTGADLEGRRMTLGLTGDEGTAGSIELRFGPGNRFEQIESGGQVAATRNESAFRPESTTSRFGTYTYERTGPRMGRLGLDYDDGSSCEVLLTFTESGLGAFVYSCGGGDAAEGNFRLARGSLFIPVILSAAGLNQSFCTSELTLTNRGEQDVELDYTYTSRDEPERRSGKASDVLPAGRQKIETNALGYLRDLGAPIPETGNQLGTLRVEFSMELEAGEQQIIPELVEALCREEMAGLGSRRGFYLGALFAEAIEGDLSGIVIGARTSSEGGGGQYGVFYNAVPEGEAFEKEAWVDGLQQNEENRSNLALVNTGEVDGSPGVFHLEIYNGETGMLEETVVTRPIPARGWHQIDGILLRANPETRQGYIRIEKVSGENPFLAYGVVNDGGGPGERSGDGAYLPARE